MALEHKRYAYELLIRGNPDGSIAAHVQHMAVITFDGEVVKREVEPPVAITPESVRNTPFQKVIGDLMAAATADKAVKDEALATLTIERDALLARNRVLETESTKRGF